MKILGFKPQDIVILSPEEIMKKGDDKWVKLKSETQSKWERRNHADHYIKMHSEPGIYKLFRLNELYDYTLNYIGMEITEEEYMDRLECLPPIPFKADIYSGYIVPECITDEIYEHIFRHGGKYYCVIMESQNKKATRSWY